MNVGLPNEFTNEQMKEPKGNIMEQVKVKSRTATTFDNSRPVFKVLIAGDKAVGKTTLIRRYVDGLFLDDTQATIGVDFSLKNMVSEDLNYVLQIWDIAGEEKFRSILPNYLIGTHVVILAFNTKKELDNLANWLEAFTYYLNDCPFFLISTKSDLGVLVSKNAIDDFVTNNNFEEYFETSSKSSKNVAKVFNAVGNLLLKKYNLV